MQRGAVLLLGLAMLTAGCIGTQGSDDEVSPDAASTPDTSDLPDLVNVSVEQDLSFHETVVDAAVGYTADLYEPTMEISESGVIYVTGHTILVDTTGAPVFMSDDDGESWEQLPFFMDAQMPAGIHGATPPPSDEIFLTAGDDGRLWGVDITLASFPVNGWCNDGAEHCYHNPNAYDEAQAQTTRTEAASGTDESCSAFNLNDRPWAAHANGTLLMVNNPGGGPVQVGAMDVPRDTYLEGPGLGGPGPVSAEWNLCAGEGGGYIPGIPDIRDDGLFAVPQIQGDKLVIVKGNADDVHDVEQRTVFNVTHANNNGTSNYGQVVFDDEGTMFVGARNNTGHEETREDLIGQEYTADVPEEGRLKLAVSTDGGESFETRTFRVGSPTGSIYMDGNMNGPGALVTWAQDGDSGTDWYGAHLTVGPDGGPVLDNVTLIVDEGPPPSAHVQGAAVGPDGRSYIVTFHGDYSAADRANPLHVWVQEEGPTLPVGDEA